MSESIKFGEFLKKARLSGNYKTQRDLAIATGISNATISRLEAGIQLPALGTIRTLSDYLPVTYSDLLFAAGYIGEEYKTKELVDHMIWYLENNPKEYSEAFNDVGHTEVDIKKWADGLSFDETISFIEFLQTIKENTYKRRQQQLQEILQEASVRFEPASMLRLPILGNIRAGSPNSRTENIEGYTLVDPDLMRGREGFALRVRGDSMIGDRIHEGDLVIVVKTEEVSPHEIAVVAINDDEATLKRVKRQGEMCMLIPSNPSLTPDLYPCSDLKIIGKVVEVKFWPK